MSAKFKQTILVVDDVVENIELLAHLLGDQVEVLFALNGADALKLCHEQDPDLVLLDIMMPVMDGYQVLAELKANPKTASIPVIFVTGIDGRGEEAKGIEAGAVDYIVKPLHPAAIRARVKNHLELKRYRDFLENLSATDGLTGLANRRRFDEALEAEWRRSARNHSELSLLMIDVDCFKAYNDKYGHLEGDQVLRFLAEVIQSKLRRPPDLAARYGGEEFACILPETNREGAYSLAERIRLGLKELKIEHTQCVADHITVSIGVATMVASPERLASELIREADTNLYKAKSSGKDKVIS